ncbi:unnamed protein product, partial [Pylaiella littoralis]
MSTTAEESEWVTHMTEQGMAYYHNRRTGETTWERPVLVAGAAVDSPLQTNKSASGANNKDADGGAPSSPVPGAPAAALSEQSDTIGGWEAIWAGEYQKYYYCNRATGEAQWETPMPDQTGGQQQQQQQQQGPPPPYSSDAAALAARPEYGSGDFVIDKSSGNGGSAAVEAAA